MMNTEIAEPNLLVNAALAAMLARPASRRDVNARADRVRAAALMECAEKGFAHLTIADIAKRARVSSATIYADFKDRDALLVSAMELLFEILASDIIDIPQDADPLQRVEQLLLAHGLVYQQPLTLWIFRLHMDLSWKGYTHLHEIGRRVFEGIDGFWTHFLGQLVDEGHLVLPDCSAVVPMLLGPVERCTIISHLAFGTSEDAGLSLAEVAQHAASQLFEAYGSATWKKARQYRGDQPSPFAIDLEAVRHAAATLQARDLSAVGPDARLEAALAVNVDELTPAQRKTNILLATAAECRRHGHSAANMQGVAVAARVSMATLYKHYEDRQSLLASALEHELRQRNSLDASLLGQHQPGASVAAALLWTAETAADPHWAWVHTLIMASELSGSSRVVACARVMRECDERELARLLERCCGLPRLAGRDLALAVNFLLGGVERTGVLSLVLFGPDAVDRSRLLQVACASAGCLLRSPAMAEAAS